MKSESEIKAAYEKIGAAAKYASRTGDNESYEVLANSAMALGWVLDIGGHVSPSFEELLKGARWAAAGGTEAN